MLCESTRGARGVGLNHLCDAMRAWKNIMSLFDKLFLSTEENDVAEAQSALFVLTLQGPSTNFHCKKRQNLLYIVNLKNN